MNAGFQVERNLAEWVLTQAASVPGVEVRQDPDVSWIFTRHPAPGNTVVLARFPSDEVASARAQEILAYHLLHRASCHWIVGPGSQPGSLGPILKSIGFSCRIHCAGMSCSLDEVPSTVRQPKGVTVRLAEERPPFEPVTTERRRRQKAISDGMAALTPKRIWYFGAWLDNHPVGRATLFAGSNEAGVYDVEVLKHARFRGIGTLLVHTALQHAASLGHTQAVLAATGAGHGVYERVGFKEVTKISFWMYGKMRQAR